MQSWRSKIQSNPDRNLSLRSSTRFFFVWDIVLHLTHSSFSWNIGSSNVKVTISTVGRYKRGLPLGMAAFRFLGHCADYGCYGDDSRMVCWTHCLAAGGAPYGVAIGFEMSIAFSMLLFPPLRYPKKRLLVGRWFWLICCPTVQWCISTWYR